MLAAVQKSQMLLSGTTYAVVNGTLLSDFCSPQATLCVAPLSLGTLLFRIPLAA